MQVPYYYSITDSGFGETSKTNREIMNLGFLPVEKKLHLLFLEKLISIIPVSYYWGWTIAAGIVFICTSIGVFHFEESFSYIPSLFMLSVLIALQPIIVIWAHKKMNLLKDYLMDIIDLTKDEILKWYEDQISIVFDEKRMLASGVLYLIVVHLTHLDVMGFSFKSFYSYAIINTVYLISGILLGFGLYPLVCTALMVYKIGKLPMNENVLLSKNLQIKGLLYSKFTICAASIYATWGFFRLSTISKFSNALNIGFYSFFALLLIAYFILPQYSIHQMIVKTKKEKLEIFSKQLMNNAKEAFHSPTKNNISVLKDFLDIEHQLDEMCVWPFGTYEVLHIVLIIIIPIIVVLLEVILGIMR